jgi:two-component system chemotaxis response regulator CheB
VVKAVAIAGLIAKSVPAESGSEALMTATNALEPQDPRTTTDVADMNERFGLPSGLTCPDCGGALWEIAERGLVRYRCHVGHQYSPDALETSHHTKVEAALWTAIRVLEEHADMKLRMADRAREAGLNEVRKGFAAGAEDSHRHAEAIRQLLFSRREIEPGEALKATTSVVGVRAAKRKRSRKSRPRRA